jgi:copper chaperone CopZ
MAESITLNVEGMKCGGCEATVRSQLQDISGVLSVLAIHQENRVPVEYDANLTRIEEIKNIINRAGYQVTS